MKKILMVIIPFIPLLGGYICCSDKFFDPNLKAGVTFVLFLQLWVYFFQGVMCSFANMTKISNFISISMSLIGSIIIMVIYNFLGIETMIFILVLCIIMYLIGYKSYEGMDRIISKVKKKFTISGRQ